MILGGVLIPSEFGLEGHSDADILSHAITDALLGALALGDIGMHFPDTDPRWKNGDSLMFLRHAYELVAGNGYQIVNVDSTVILERPKLKDYRAAIREKLAAALGLAPAASFGEIQNGGAPGTGRRRALGGSPRGGAAVPAITARPPGPKNPPIVGNLRTFRANPLAFLTNAARQYGDLVYFKVVRQHMYLVSHPDSVREILVTNQGNFVKSRALQRAKVLLGEGLLTSEGQHHLRQRRLVQPAFHRERLEGYASAMSEWAVRARERWQPGSSMDVSVEMAQLTLSVVAKTLFSADVASEASEIGSAMTTVLEMFRLLLMPFAEYLDKLPLPHGAALKKRGRGWMPPSMG